MENKFFNDNTKLNKSFQNSSRIVFVDNFLAFFGFRSLAWKFYDENSYSESCDFADLMQLERGGLSPFSERIKGCVDMPFLPPARTAPTRKTLLPTRRTWPDGGWWPGE